MTISSLTCTASTASGLKSPACNIPCSVIVMRLKERREVVGDKTGRGSDLAPELERVGIGIADRNVVRVGVGEGRNEKTGCEYRSDD